jgi:hypothetical protein
MRLFTLLRSLSASNTSCSLGFSYELFWTKFTNFRKKNLNHIWLQLSMGIPSSSLI